MDLEDFIQQQVEAYEAKNIAEFCSFYSDTIEIFRLPSGEKIVSGKNELRKKYSERFKAKFNFEVTNRKVFGHFVMDWEKITENGFTKEIIIIYEVQNSLIQNVWSIQIDQFLRHLPEKSPEESIENLFERENIRIERIVSHGHITAEEQWYDQEKNEFVVVVKGGAKLLFEGNSNPVQLKANDGKNIPAHKRHRVIWTDPKVSTVWLTFFYDTI
jgi:cupin 2 domain-containing protein